MNDRVDIAPDEVKASGSLIGNEARDAGAALIALFDAAAPAQRGNPGFASGAKLVEFNTRTQMMMRRTIQELANASDAIISASESLRGSDERGAESMSRIASALKGLGSAPIPGA